MKLRYKVYYLGLALFLLVFLLPVAQAADFPPLNINATSLVPGEESRYTVTFKTDKPLDLSAGATVYVDFPKDYTFVQEDNERENPGITLASVRYKNPEDKFYGVLQGNIAQSLGNTAQLMLKIGESNNIIHQGVDVSIVIPGVINPITKGAKEIIINIKDGDGATAFSGKSEVVLGDAPKGIPANLKLSAPVSNKVYAVWDAVDGSIRYQLLYSSEPDGQYILAYDFGKEPLPGEEGSVSGTYISYSGIGNGGLVPGRTYYFKLCKVSLDQEPLGGRL